MIKALRFKSVIKSSSATKLVCVYCNLCCRTC
uniref:Uncharacterized protein n=1 Tax=Rhizophora mucronata TaxID=61149 RepID=A0A2P2QWX5_RHIMU